MEERENRKPAGNQVLLTVIAVATLLVAVIGATFAFFSISISGNDDTKNSVIVQTASLGIIYDGGELIDTTATPISPGWTASKTITVSNKSNVDMVYNVVWEITENEISPTANMSQGADASIDADYFVYSISGGGQVAKNNVAVPLTTTNIYSNVPIAAGTGTPPNITPVVHTYTFDIAFNNSTTIDQSFAMDKDFTSRIQITAEPVSQ